jgi:DDE superfamily endonuclease
VGTATAWRYVTETVALLAARAPKLREAVRDAKKAGYPFAVLDGTLVWTDRVAADRPFFSGKRHCHGMDLPVIAGPLGHLLWVSGALPGSVHDMKAAWIWGIERELAAANLPALADKGYQGASHAKTPYRAREARIAERGQLKRSLRQVCSLASGRRHPYSQSSSRLARVAHLGCPGCSYGCVSSSSMAVRSHPPRYSDLLDGALRTLTDTVRAIS